MAEIVYLDYDLETVRKRVLTGLENACGEPLLPGDERRIFAEGMILEITQLYAACNDAVKQSHLRYARGENLDAIGETRGGDKLLRTEAQKAQTVLRFSINRPKTYNILIPKGVRATYDGSHFFATKYNSMIQAGETFTEVEAEATIPGSEMSGIHIGTINQIVDRSSASDVDSVENIKESFGGTDIEDDEHYRDRIRKFSNQYSTAGPAKAYQYWALQAHPSVVDATVISDREPLNVTLPVYDHHAFVCAYGLISIDTGGREYSYEDDLVTIEVPEDVESIDISLVRTMRGKVKIFPICANGEIPSQDILDMVLASCSQPDVRPLTDQVFVEAPEQVFYDLEFVVYVKSTDLSQVQANIEGENGAIERYVKWQDETMNQDINPDELVKYILCPHWTPDQTGAYRVEMKSPVYQRIEINQIPKWSGKASVRYEVIYG